MKVVNDDPRNVPTAVLVLPQTNKLSFINWLCALLFYPAKAMNPDFERTEAFQAVHLHRSCNEFPGDVTAGMLSDAIG